MMNFNISYYHDYGSVLVMKHSSKCDNYTLIMYLLNDDFNINIVN